MKKSQIFTQVPVKRPNRSFFDLSHEVKMSAKFATLYPVLIQETLPGDTFRNTSTVMMRLAPMLAPIMHRLDVTTHFFFVPNRLLLPDKTWEDFITGGQDGDFSYILPFFTPAGLTTAGKETYMYKGTLWDYLGLPVTIDSVEADSTEQISSLPFQAYTKIWNDYYRDPNFDDEIDVTPAAGGVQTANADAWMEMRRRGWQKDYFTACLPFAQRGDSVMLPLAAQGIGVFNPETTIQLAKSDGTIPAVGDTKIANSGGIGSYRLQSSGSEDLKMLNTVDVTINSAESSINDFRTALAVQSWLENNARGGYRYIEQIMSHFGVRVRDYRLQRAEYLGGGKQPIQISEVLATAKTEVDTSTTPVGDLSGHGISVGKSNQFTYRCEEHGFIIGIMSVMPTTAYQQGIDRMWSRREPFDWAWPEYAHLGEQAVLSKEVFYAFTNEEDANNNTTFGYIPRFAEYKYKQDRVAGDFRDTLSFWHLGRIFTERPVLDSDFTTAYEYGGSIEESMRRIFAVESDNDYLWIDIFHRFTAKRPLPYFGVPQLIG